MSNTFDINSNTERNLYEKIIIAQHVAVRLHSAGI